MFEVSEVYLYVHIRVYPFCVYILTLYMSIVIIIIMTTTSSYYFHIHLVFNIEQVQEYSTTVIQDNLEWFPSSSSTSPLLLLYDETAKASQIGRYVRRYEAKVAVNKHSVCLCNRGESITINQVVSFAQVTELISCSASSRLQ